MLRRQEGYALRRIKEIDYLMPYGQMIADQRKGMVLNETGTFLWNFLEQPKEKEEILEAFACHYELTPEEQREMEEQVEAFLGQLQALGVLVEELKPIGQPCWGTLKIGSLRTGLYGTEDFFSEEFRPFLETEDESEKKQYQEQKIEVLRGREPFRSNGKIRLKNKELEVIETEDSYELLFPTMKNIHKVYMTKDVVYVRVYCLPTGEKEDQENLFHAIRHFFLLYAQKNGYYAIHSASILYRDRAWLFSGHSGMGKSTHTALWHETVGALYLNGDLNLIGKTEDGTEYCVYGIPWCGTSKQCVTENVKLGGIVLLGRDTMDHVEELEPFEQVLRLAQRMISPSWTEEMEKSNFSFAEKLAEKIPVCKLKCTPNPSAVNVIRAWIDQRLDQRQVQPGGRAAE